MKKNIIAMLLFFIFVLNIIAVNAETIEQRLDDLENRISVLEELVDLIKAWLFYPEFNDVCDAVENECSTQPPPEIECYTNSDCGTDGYIGDYYCMDDDVWRNYRNYICVDAGTEDSYCDHNDWMYLEEDCNDLTEYCEDGECVLIEQKEEAEVIFRTNAVDGDYKSGTWIAVDTDDDDVLEGYVYSGGTGLLAACSGTLLVNTPEGYSVYLYSDKTYVCIPLGGKFIWKKYYSGSATAETSSEPTEPYSSNNQEVYDGSSPTPTGGESDGEENNDSEVNVDIDIVAGPA